MATNKNSPKTEPKSEIKEQKDVQPTEPKEGDPALEPVNEAPQASVDKPDDSEETGDGLETAPLAEIPDLAETPAIESLGIHERLEDLELAMISAPQDKAGALNRVVLLTGTLKTALPNAIAHVEDEQLRADMEAVLSLL